MVPFSKCCYFLLTLKLKYQEVNKTIRFINIPKSFLLFFASSIILFGCTDLNSNPDNSNLPVSTVASNTHTSLALELDLLSNDFSVHQPVPLILKFVNRSDKDINLDSQFVITTPWSHYFDKSSTIIICIIQNGKLYGGPIIEISEKKLMEIKPVDLVNIKTGEQYIVQAEIDNNLYIFSSGEYQVYANYEAKPDKNDNHPRWLGSIKSNIVSFFIK
jgi:hypothetical protein